MKRGVILAVAVILVLVGLFGCSGLRASRLRQTQTRQISVEQYVDKMKAGWIGQMAGVGWGGAHRVPVQRRDHPGGQDAPVGAGPDQPVRTG